MQECLVPWVPSFVVGAALPLRGYAAPTPFLQHHITSSHQGLSECECGVRLRFGQEARNLDWHMLPPDAAELNAHSTNFLIEGEQSRRTAGKKAPVMAVPTGLSPEELYSAAIASPSPLSKETIVSDDLDFAIRKVCELGEGINKWREERFLELTRAAILCSASHAQLAANRSSTVLQASSSFNIGNLLIASR